MVRWLKLRAPRESASASALEDKASKAGAIIALHSAGRPVWTPRTYAALARAGFMKNAVVYRAVRMVAEAAASIPWLLYEGATELDDHPLLQLLKKPNAHQGGADLLEALYGHLLVAGNAYAEAVTVDGVVRELYALRPDRMSVVPDASGWPAAFEYAANGRTVRFNQEGDGAVPPILHVASFHPLDDYYGFPPLEAAQVSLDVHNAANAWNKALLDNAARPSGALVYKGEGNSNLSEEQFERLRDELQANFSGSTNAGRPLLLEGGLDLADHEPHAEGHGLHAAEERRGARDRARLRRAADAARHSRRQHLRELSRGEPRLLAADGAAARLALHCGARQLARAGRRGEGLRLSFDADQVEALWLEREALWRRVNDADFLTPDEKREAVGYGAKGG